MSFFHTYPDVPMIDHPHDPSEPQYWISFKSSCVVIGSDGELDYDDYKCVANFASLDDAIEWHSHYCKSTIMIGASDLQHGMDMYMSHFINCNDGSSITVPMPTDSPQYANDFDHSYWENLVVGDIECY